MTRAGGAYAGHAGPVRDPASAVGRGGMRLRHKHEEQSAALLFVRDVRRAASADQRIGGAYMMPPLFHRLLTPRGSFSADFGPTLRSKISP